jgi:hypothetical protein
MSALLDHGAADVSLLVPAQMTTRSANVALPIQRLAPFSTPKDHQAEGREDQP